MARRPLLIALLACLIIVGLVFIYLNVRTPAVSRRGNSVPAYCDPETPYAGELLQHLWVLHNQYAAAHIDGALPPAQYLRDPIIAGQHPAALTLTTDDHVILALDATTSLDAHHDDPRHCWVLTQLPANKERAINPDP